jgi:hypothetical protein
MAKKMQLLDESPGFRPFQFRIAAFINGFAEEVSFALREGSNLDVLRHC